MKTLKRFVLPDIDVLPKKSQKNILGGYVNCGGIDGYVVFCDPWEGSPYKMWSPTCDLDNDFPECGGVLCDPCV